MKPSLRCSCGSDSTQRWDPDSHNEGSGYSSGFAYTRCGYVDRRRVRRRGRGVLRSWEILEEEAQGFPSGLWSIQCIIIDLPGCLVLRSTATGASTDTATGRWSRVHYNSIHGGGSVPGFHPRGFLDSKIQDLEVTRTKLFPPPEYNSKRQAEEGWMTFVCSPRSQNSKSIAEPVSGRSRLGTQPVRR